MLKKIIIALLIMLFLVTAAGCGEKIILHCDKCGTEVEVDADSNMTEEWAIFCEECAEEVDNGIEK